LYRALELGRLLVDPRRERERSVVIGVREARHSVRAHARGELQVLRLLRSANGTGRRSAVGEQVMQAPEADLNAGALGSSLPGEILICTWLPDWETCGSG
jgi:hypothetical protein